MVSILYFTKKLCQLQRKVKNKKKVTGLRRLSEAANTFVQAKSIARLFHREADELRMAAWHQ